MVCDFQQVFQQHLPMVRLHRAMSAVADLQLHATDEAHAEVPQGPVAVGDFLCYG